MNTTTPDDEGTADMRFYHLYKSKEYFKILVILVGDMGVGKSSLLSKYVKGNFPTSPLPTIAIEFATKIIQLKEGGYVKAQIWDTAGQEKYKSITS
jgi:small GTP-binding protein